MRSLFFVFLSSIGLMANANDVSNVKALKTSKQKVLIVVTSHDKLGNTGKKTGFWLPELTHPYYEFIKAGFQVDVASPQGGSAPIDMKSFEEKDEFNDHFLKDATLMAKVIRTIPLSKIESKDYSAIIFSGGSGAMWDFTASSEVDRISREIYEKGGIVSAICHGTAALSDIKLSNGKYLVDGKNFAAFTREEEAMIDQLNIIPFLLEERLAGRGGKHIYGRPWEVNVVVDGRLITGQNPASAKLTALKIIELSTLSQSKK